MMSNLLGHFLKTAPAFRGRGRLVRHWVNRRRRPTLRMRTLPGGARIPCDLSVPYEATVWLQQEEERDLQVLRELLKPGQVFVDGGANIGLWTLVAARVVHLTGLVLAFEPNPTTFLSLTANVAANELDASTRLFNLACGETAGELPFRCHAAHNLSQIVPHSDDRTIQVPVATLDTVLGNSAVHGLKLDVEGFELAALRGAVAILQTQRPWICVEFNPLLAGHTRLRDWPVHRWLTDLGYAGRRFAEALDHTASARLPNDWTTAGYCNLFYRPLG